MPSFWPLLVNSKTASYNNKKKKEKKNKDPYNLHHEFQQGVRHTLYRKNTLICLILKALPDDSEHCHAANLPSLLMEV